MQLARFAPRDYVQSRDLAKQEQLPNKFLEAILLALRRGGFLESKVGSGGGYRLSRSAQDISVGDLVRRLEGRMTVNDHLPEGEHSAGSIGVHLINEKLTSATDAVLDEMTLDELVDQICKAGGTPQQMYYI